MAVMMAKVTMEWSKAGWSVMPRPQPKKKSPEKMSLGELLYFALMGEGTAA